MIRFILFLSFLALYVSPIYGQITVFQDEKGQVLTTEDIYSTGSTASAAHKKVIYLGSPFLTFPVWQEGKVLLDTHGQELSCSLAYNLVSNEVLCRFAGDSAVQTITPEVFTVNGNSFVRQQNKLLKIDYRLYSTVLYNGPTKLLLSLTKRIDAYATNTNSYTKELVVNGTYTLLNSYYIRKGDAKPEFITLTKNSLLSALYEQAVKIEARLPPAKRLTPVDVATALVYYDSLMAIDWVNKPAFAVNPDSSQISSTRYAISKAPLSKDPVFNQILHHKILYPAEAWTQGIYGRVYAGFEISQQGRIKNIVILSPDNIGMGFIESVRNGLEKLSDLDPAFSGTYALPIAFTFANRKEKAGAHIPINRLPENRLTGRILLEEFVVPMVVIKPITASRETWGYYKEQ